MIFLAFATTFVVENSSLLCYSIIYILYIHAHARERYKKEGSSGNRCPPTVRVRIKKYGRSKPLTYRKIDETQGRLPFGQRSCDTQMRAFPLGSEAATR